MGITNKIKTPETKYGVNVAIPNTSHQKLEVMLNIAKSIYELSKAVNGVNIQVTISDNVFNNMERGVNMEAQKTDVDDSSGN